MMFVEFKMEKLLLHSVGKNYTLGYFLSSEITEVILVIIF